MAAHGSGGSIGLWWKALYGAGEMANAIKVVTFALYSMFFATMVTGLPATWIGVIGFVTVLWDALIDPFLGYVSDNGGSARKFRMMVAGAATMGVGYWAFFSPPPGLPVFWLFVWLLISSLIVRTATSMYSVPYYSFGANLTQDYNERTSVTAVRGLMSTVGTLAAAALSFMLFFPQRAAGVDPKLSRSGYQQMGLWFGLAMTVVAFAALLAMLPLRARLKRAPDETSAPGRLFRRLWATTHIRSFRILLLASCCVVIGSTLTGTLQLYFLTYYVKITGSAALSSTQASFFGGGLVGTVIWARVARGIDKRTLFLFSCLSTAALLFAAWPLFGEGHPLGTGNLRAVMVTYALAGGFSCILWFLPPSMIADVADECEWRQGRRGDGSLFGMFSLGQQAATGMAVLLAGTLLDHFVGISPAQPVQSAATVARVGIAYAVGPAVLFVLAALLISGYKLTRSEVESIQNGLRGRRAEREASPVDVAPV